MYKFTINDRHSTIIICDKIKLDNHFKHALLFSLKGLSHLVQSCLLYRSCMSKDSAHSTGHVGHFFPIKYCVACKKSTLKVLINLGFVTSFEDSHYILLFRYIYGAQLIQRFCYSKHLHVNRNYRPNGTATSLSPKCYSANVPSRFLHNCRL